MLSVAPLPGSDHISPAGPVLVTATTGTITDVTMRNDAGKMIPGVLTPDNKAWKPTGPLGYGRTYTMTIAAHGPGGMPSRQTSSFTTVSPDYQAEVYRDTVGGTPIQEGGTYGVGTGRGALRRTRRQQGERRTAPRRHHHPAGTWVVVLARRPDRALAT